jgi:hypothetical protein
MIVVDGKSGDVVIFDADGHLYKIRYMRGGRTK